MNRIHPDRLSRGYFHFRFLVFSYICAQIKQFARVFLPALAVVLKIAFSHNEYKLYSLCFNDLSIYLHFGKKSGRSLQNLPLLYVGVPGAIRTRGLPLRRRMLYPAELRRHIYDFIIFSQFLSFTHVMSCDGQRYRSDKNPFYRLLFRQLLRLSPHAPGVTNSS